MPYQSQHLTQSDASHSIHAEPTSSASQRSLIRSQAQPNAHNEETLLATPLSSEPVTDTSSTSTSQTSLIGGQAQSIAHYEESLIATPLSSEPVIDISGPEQLLDLMSSHSFVQELGYLEHDNEWISVSNSSVDTSYQVEVVDQLFTTETCRKKSTGHKLLTSLEILEEKKQQQARKTEKELKAKIRNASKENKTAAKQNTGAPKASIKSAKAQTEKDIDTDI
ncbi:hypothetical protein DPMN_037067 [Dreissena polymorpha]|uniref:Uncharacterized protein n=1 Tax=Dreissena polymorpha TaxID=45954 RepID=A0A9D4RPG3_DREPO|nr:hypothetical protein DPMN_037067 [Dreissena polymorpha]